MKKWLMLAALAVGLAVPSLAIASTGGESSEGGWCCPCCGCD